MRTQVMIVGSAKTKDLKRRKARIRLAGNWLKEYGFEPCSLVIAKFEKDNIALTLKGRGTNVYNSIVKDLIGKEQKLFEVKEVTKNKKVTSYIEFKGYWLEKFGFNIGDVMLIKSDEGAIDIKKLNIEQLN